MCYGSKDGYSGCREAVLIKSYALGKGYGLGRIVKKSYGRADGSSCCSLCNGGIDLATYEYAASTVVVNTGGGHVGGNQGTVGSTVEIKLEHALGSIVNIILKNYALTVGKNDSGLIVCRREVGILDGKAGSTRFCLVIHFDTANIREYASVEGYIYLAVSPETVSVMRPVEGTVGEDRGSLTCIRAVSEYAVIVGNGVSVKDTEGKVHEACVINVTACNLTEGKICKGNVLACRLDIALDIHIDLSGGILTNELDGGIAAAECVIKNNLAVNLNNYVAGCGLNCVKSLGKSSVALSVNLYGVNRLNAVGGEISRGDLNVLVAVCVYLYIINTDNLIFVINLSNSSGLSLINRKAEGYRCIEGLDLNALVTNENLRINLKHKLTVLNRGESDLKIGNGTCKLLIGYAEILKSLLCLLDNSRMIGGINGTADSRVGGNVYELITVGKSRNVINRGLADGKHLGFVRAGHLKSKSDLKIGVSLENCGSYVDSGSEILHVITNILIGKICIVCRNDGVLDACLKLYVFTGDNDPAEVTVITCKITVGSKENITCKTVNGKVEVTLILTELACRRLLVGLHSLEVHYDLKGTVDRLVTVGPAHVIVTCGSKKDGLKHLYLRVGKQTLALSNDSCIVQSSLAVNFNALLKHDVMSVAVDDNVGVNREGLVLDAVFLHVNNESAGS